MSTVKVNNLLERVISTGAKSKIKLAKDIFRDINITLDGFDEDLSSAIKQIIYVIIALANGSLQPFKLVNGEKQIAHDGELIVEYDRDGKQVKTKRISAITWTDICDCIYDYVPIDSKCVLKIQAGERLVKFAPPKISIEIIFDVERERFVIYVGGTNPNRRGLQKNFIVDASRFYKVDEDGEPGQQSDDDFDNEMDMFFKSRSASESSTLESSLIASSVSSLTSSFNSDLSIGISGPNSVSSIASDSM